MKLLLALAALGVLVFSAACSSNQASDIDEVPTATRRGSNTVVRATNSPSITVGDRTSASMRATQPPLAALHLILPFEIADSYDEAGEAFGGISFSGRVPIGPFGGGWPDIWTVEGKKNPDLLFELVPGTVLLASASGTIRIFKQDLHRRDPDGVYTHDWEIHIRVDRGRYLVYDHLVDIQVSDGQHVEQGDLLGRGLPGRLSGSGEVGPVEFVEWGLSSTEDVGGKPPETAVSLCPQPHLITAHQRFLERVLEQMRVEGLPSGSSVCLTEAFVPDGSSDHLISWD